jgi:hypothetical protein
VVASLGERVFFIFFNAVGSYFSRCRRSVHLRLSGASEVGVALQLREGVQSACMGKSSGAWDCFSRFERVPQFLQIDAGEEARLEDAFGVQDT